MTDAAYWRILRGGMAETSDIISRAAGLLIFFGSGLSLLLSLSQIMTTERRTGNMILSLLYLATACLLFEHYTSMYAGIFFTIAENPVQWALLFGIRFMKFLPGPLFYLYIHSLLEKNFSIKLIHLVHFVPFALSMAAAGAVFVSSHASRSPEWDMYTKTGPILLLSFIHMIAYMIKILQEIHLGGIILIRTGPAMRATSWIALLFVVVLAAVFAFTLTGLQHLESFGVMLVSFLIIVTFLTGQRYPEFMQWFSSEVKKNRYERSLIAGLNTADIQRRLKELMEDEKLFCDEDLTLHRTAMHLSITDHQLSEFLNSNLDTNFNGFVNSYRVREAMEMLIREPDRSILSIAYSVGFNSKSVFYSSFTKTAGMSPKEYRKRCDASWDGGKTS